MAPLEATDSRVLDQPHPAALLDQITGGTDWGLLRAAGQGRSFTLPFLDGQIRLSASDTGHAFALLEMTVRPGCGPDRHIHRNEDEFFYVLEGTYEFQCGGQRLACSPGDLVKVTRGVPHQLTAGSAGGRHLTLFFPAGPEGWFLEAASLLGAGQPSLERLAQLFDQYGMVLVDESTTRMTNEAGGVHALVDTAHPALTEDPR